MANIENEESIKRYLTLNPTIWLMNNVNREEGRYHTCFIYEESNSVLLI